ncbi:hypothetical protein [Pseudomonas sp.]|uniref:hypothetical protein n=1 Tax=Pseudomonas sp. TaxID=306 RepID=UPI003CC5AA47
MGFFSSLFRGTKGFAAATNALLAEHMLPTLTEAQGDDIREQIAYILSAGGGMHMDREQVYIQFNSLPRVMQLNLIALALNDLGVSPPFKGEFWHEVRNPFLPNIYNPSDFEAVQSRLSHQHGIHFHLPVEPIHFMDI